MVCEIYLRKSHITVKSVNNSKVGSQQILVNLLTGERRTIPNVGHWVLEYDEDGVVEAPYFKIDLPHQGLITVARPLDYESQKMHVIRIIASVRYHFLTIFLVKLLRSIQLNMSPIFLLSFNIIGSSR